VVSGAAASRERRFVVTEMDDATGVMLARNAYNADFRRKRGVLARHETPRSHTGGSRRVRRTQSQQ
jgi:hypothetical protein